MNWQTTLLVIVAAAFLGAAFLFSGNYFSVPVSENGPTSITTFSVSNENPVVGEKIIVRVETTGKGINEITLEGADTSPVKCTNNETCRANFQISFGRVGTYNLKAKATGNFPPVESSKTIYVIDRKKTCIDGTDEGSCSSEQPFFCGNSKLTGNCPLCGCPLGKECTNNGCVAETPPLEISNAQFTVPFAAPKSKTEVIVDLQNKNASEVFAGATYEIEFVLSKSGTTEGTSNIYITRTFALEEDLGKNEVIPQKFSIDALLEESVYDLNISITSESSKLSSFYSKKALTVRLDAIPPSNPSLTNARKTGSDEIELLWQANSEDDLSHYRIYRSIEESAAFLSYTYAGSIGKGANSVVLENLGQKKHYFVIKAVDYFGNESGFSNVVSASLD